MATMVHGPYTATLEFYDDPGVFVGRVFLRRPEGGCDAFDFQGHSVDDLRREFAVSAKMYEEGCRADGREPTTPGA